MKITNKKILVTGVTGTVGERVATSLLHKCKEVRVLIRDERYANKFLKLGMKPVVGELTDKDSLLKAITNIDIIVHCAAYLGHDLNLAIDSNVTGVENLADIALKLKLKRFIHISSISVYGEPIEGCLDEKTPIVQQHEEVYIHTKAQSERILNKYAKKGLDVITLRPGAICAEENSYWGDRQINRMISADLIDWVNPEDVIAWIHADNLVEMIHLVLSKGKPGEVYNAIDGNYPEKEFRVKLISALGKEMELPNRENERPIYSNDKIKELGYNPIKTFEETITNLERRALNLKK